MPLIVAGIGMMLAFGEARVLGRLWPVGLAACVISLPFMIGAASASVNALDPDLENAAANCGAPPLQTFLTVTLPAVMPGVITGSLILFILAFNEFIVSLLLTDARIVTLPVLIYNSIRGVTTPDLAAVSVVYIVVAAAAIRALDRLVGWMCSCARSERGAAVQDQRDRGRLTRAVWLQGGGRGGSGRQRSPAGDGRRSFATRCAEPTVRPEAGRAGRPHGRGRLRRRPGRRP